MNSDRYKIPRQSIRCEIRYDRIKRSFKSKSTKKRDKKQCNMARSWQRFP